MGGLLEFIENKEDVKLVIRDYVEGEIDLIYTSLEYYLKHWHLFKRKTDRKQITHREFNERLYSYIWTPKVSELLIVLYLEECQGNNPSIYQLNRLLRRTSKQYSATLKAVKKLEVLKIVYTKPIDDSSRKEKQVFINRGVAKIYGDDEFKKMMLEEWDTDAKEYIRLRLNWISNGRKLVEKRIKRIKKRIGGKNG